MKRSIWWLLGALLGGVLAVGSSFADDLGFIRISSTDDVRHATRIFAYAHHRQDDRFLVTATAEQLRLWTQVGGSFEAISTGIDPGSAVLVYELREPDRQAPIVAAAGMAMPLGDGITILPISSATAYTLQEQGIKSQRLTDIQIPFFAQPRISVPAALADIYPSDSVAALISTDSLMGYIRKLESYRTRYLTTDSMLAARDWLLGKFQDWGYSNAELQPFYDGGWGWQYNVKAVKLGTTEPDRVIVIGGHYDSYSNNAQILAPGADDDASGVAVTLELARVFKDIPFRKTIIFMPFGAEEVGMHGSNYAAGEFQLAGTNLEVMFNYDMVAYEPDAFKNLNLQAGLNTAYQQMMVDAAARLTDLHINAAPVSQNSDHAPFNNRGYPIVFAIEGDFNFPNYHTTHDSSTKLNTGFLTDVARMGAATAAIVADAPAPQPFDSIIDQGDGQSLQVFWSSCPPDYQFTVLAGTSTGNYTAQYPVPPGNCSHLITGLTPGQLYYVALRPQVIGGYNAAYLFEDTTRSLVNPRAPIHIDARPDLLAIQLHWASNREADLDHYEIYRKAETDLDFSLLVPSISGTSYTDNAVEHHVHYDYELTAVDNDGNRSPRSATVQSMAATFDQGVLVVNEITPESQTAPTPEHFAAWLDTVLPGPPVGLAEVLDFDDGLRRDVAGQYSSLFWIDDDVGTKNLRYNQDSLRWYGSFQTNMLICGYQTISFFPGPVTTGHFLYDQFHLEGYSVLPQFDCIGASGATGWPTLDTDTLRGYPIMSMIPELQSLPGAEVIYRYKSRTHDPTREGLPIGIAYDGPLGKRILLAFPIFYMRPVQVQAFLSAVRSWFGEAGGSGTSGDLDGSGFVDIVDLIIAVEYIFHGIVPSPGGRAIDVNGDCRADPGDLQYYVDYIFFDGLPPWPSCAP